MKGGAVNTRINAIDTRADVSVRVRSGVVTVQVKQAVILILVIVTTDVQHDTRRVIVAVVVKNRIARPLVWHPEKN